MASKDKEDKGKKIKIIKEFVNTPFKEIKPEKKEENLEEELEEKEEEIEFPGFSGGERASPVLQFSKETSENPALEKELERTPTASTTSTTTDTKVYNMPDYGTRTYETEEREKARIIPTESQGRGQQNLNLPQLDQQMRESWFEDRIRTEEDIRKYQEVKRIEEDERKFPFRRTERKRERILK